MLTLIISLVICIAILAVIFLFVWRHTDWKKIDETNQEMYDADGDHIYYDRRAIEQKKKNQKQ